MWNIPGSSVLIVSLGWFLTDKVVEPKLASDEVDGDLSDLPQMEELTDAELLNRCKSHHQIGQVRMARGDLPEAKSASP